MAHVTEGGLGRVLTPGNGNSVMTGPRMVAGSWRWIIPVLKRSVTLPP